MPAIKSRHVILFITRRFWSFLFGCIIAFAVLVQIGRQAFPLVNDYRELIADSLGEQLGADIHIEQISAKWQGLRPQIILGQVRLHAKTGEEIFRVKRAHAELSLFDSVAQQGLAWRTIIFEEFSTTIEQRENNSWGIKGYQGGTANTDNPLNFDDPMDIFLFGRRVEIRSASLNFNFINGKTSVLDIPVIALENDRFFHRISADLNLDNEESLHFVMEGYGDPRNKEHFSASGYLKLNQIPVDDFYAAIKRVKHDVDGENSGEPPATLPLEQTEDQALEHEAVNTAVDEPGRLDLELWFKGSPKSGMTTRGAINLTGLPAALQEHIDLPDRLTAAIAGAWRQDSGWFFNFQDLQLNWAGQDVPLDTFSFYGQGRRVGLRVAHFDIGKLSDLFIGANKGKDNALVNVISELKLAGKLNNIDVAYVGKEAGWVKAKAYLSEGYAAAFMGSPELSNIGGYVESTVFGGYIDADIKNDFSLFLPKVFNDKFVLDDVKGQLAWRIDLAARSAFLQSAHLSGYSDGNYVSGFFAMQLPFSDEVGEPSLDLSIYAQSSPVSDYSLYVPRNVPDQVTSWLAIGLGDGTVRDINVLYSGSVHSRFDFSPVYQVRADADALAIKFDSAWPVIEQIKGNVFLDGDSVSAQLQSGKFQGNDVAAGRLSIHPNQQGKHVLELSAELSGLVADAKRALLSSPLSTVLDDILEPRSFTGTYRSLLSVSLPFENIEEHLDYSADVELVDASLFMPLLNLQLNKINGHFAVSKKDLIKASDLQAELWGEKLSASISHDEKRHKVDFDFDMKVNAGALKVWLARPELFFLNDNFSARGELVLPLSSESGLSGPRLVVRSDLRNVLVDLPDGLGKKQGEQGLFELELRAQDDGILYEYNHNNQLALMLKTFTANTVDSSVPPVPVLPAVLLAIGEKVDTKQVLTPGLAKISGHLALVDYERWALLVDAFLAEQQRLNLASQATEIDTAVESTVDDEFRIQANLAIEKFQFADVNLQDMALNIDANNQRWRFTGDSDLFDGSITLPLDGNAMLLDIQYLSLFEELAGQEASDDSTNSNDEDNKQSIFHDFDLSSVDAMQVSVQRLRIAGEEFGRWHFSVQPEEGGLYFSDIDAEIRHLHIGREIPAEFRWSKINGAHQSHVKARIQTTDIGAALEAWQQERLLDSERVWIDLDLSWDAEPDMVALELLQGKTELNLFNGSFIRGAEAGENPLLRLIALFNIDNFARRVRLDFSDLAAEGFAFDNVSAVLNFDKGIMTFPSPALVESSSSKMKVAGSVDLVNETVDTQVVVTLPVAGNLAVATAFLAGVPAGLSVYVVSKMFSSQVDKASSISYSVRGPWVDPKMSVLKVFDDSAAKAKADDSRNKEADPLSEPLH